MSELPSTPYFFWNARAHSIDLEHTAYTRTRMSHRALMDGHDSETVVFDSDGALWTFSLERPKEGLGKVARFLAHTLYNPTREVAWSWTKVRDYPLEELRIACLDAVEFDDDILTQFVERDALSERIRKCQTFNEILDTWEWLGIPHDDES